MVVPGGVPDLPSHKVARGAAGGARTDRGPGAREQTLADPSVRLSWEELRPHLDAEVARLPVEYRDAFILCHLEGKTNEEAARELGCPVGTIQSRLSRARARLRSRLRRQGLGPESIPFIFFIQRPQAPADVPPALVYTAARSAARWLTEHAGRAASTHEPRRGKRRWLRRAVLALLLLTTGAVALAFGVRWIGPLNAAPAPAAPAGAGGCHGAAAGAR